MKLRESTQSEMAQLMMLLILMFALLKSSLGLVVTGATGGLNTTDGSRPFRYNIADFYQSGPAWDLYILSLASIQQLDQSELTSYFQISGIHGFPHIPWDGVMGHGTYPGYCMHASTPFAPWHRPYVALFEVVWNAAQEIALLYPNETRSDYQVAATNLRVPYWDWMAQPALPDCVTWKSILVNTPDEGSKNISNPLYSYKFQSDAAGNGFPIHDPMANFTETVRWWNPYLQESNQSAASSALLANANTIISIGYQMFTTNNNYTSFSCTWPGGELNSGTNLENIHNSIHNSVGGYGHMLYPEVAAFDPVFWLHHANVDRMLAMWQALYPDSYIEPTVNAYGSYYELPGTIDSDTTPLAPFHLNENGSLYSMATVRDLDVFGYAYTELPDWTMNATQLADNVRMQINLLYSPNSTSDFDKRASQTSQRSSNNLALAFDGVTFQDALAMGVNRANFQWFAKVLIDTAMLDNGLAIDFFMGEPPMDVSLWPTAGNLIGSHGLFVSSGTAPSSSASKPQALSEGQVSFTHTLLAGVERGMLQDLSPASVLPLLQQGLRWRARSPHGCEVDPRTLMTLSITVGSMSVTPATSIHRFPLYGKVQWHADISKGDFRHL